MPQPSVLTYNELDGEEIRRILENRFQQTMDGIPYLQRHITLPRMRMTLNIKIEIWADQPQPETIRLGDSVTVEYVPIDKPDVTFEAESVDSTAPIPGGMPPDALREAHGLPIVQPGPGERAIGAHMQIVDNVAVDARIAEAMPGLKISRTGSGEIDGEVVGPRGATVAKIDPGPAGLRRGEMDRSNFNFSAGKSGRDQ